METRADSIESHSGGNVKLIWPTKHFQWRGYFKQSIPPFSFQVYISKNALHDAIDGYLFHTVFLAYFQQLVSPALKNSCHLEIYDEGFANILCCVDHQRKEVAWRNRNGIWPHLVENWSVQSTAYRGFIIVIDTLRWKEEGLVLADFDPVTEHESEVLQAKRCSDVDVLKDAIWDRWIRAGNEWRSRDLEWRNQGGFSPALYPAVDPAAHEDAEHEALDPPSELIRKRLIDTLDDDELEASAFPYGSPNVDWQHRVDSSGQRTCTLWSSKNSASRPPFSITFDCGTSALLPPLSIFRALDQGPLADVPWSLEVKTGYRDMHVSLEEHSMQFERRCPRRLAESRACVQMRLSKIIADRLPVELVDAVEEMSLQPEMPDTSSRDRRHPFRSVLLWIDPEGSVSEGPQMMFSQPMHEDTPRTSRETTLVRADDEEQTSDDHWHPVISVIRPRSWQGTADKVYELYEVWKSEQMRECNTEARPLQAT